MLLTLSRRSSAPTARGVLQPSASRTIFRLYATVIRRRLAFATTSTSGSTKAISVPLIGFRSLLALDTKLQGVLDIPPPKPRYICSCRHCGPSAPWSRPRVEAPRYRRVVTRLARYRTQRWAGPAFGHAQREADTMALIAVHGLATIRRAVRVDQGPIGKLDGAD
jgi:hypothetical protein